MNGKSPKIPRTTRRVTTKPLNKLLPDNPVKRAIAAKPNKKELKSFKSSDTLVSVDMSLPSTSFLDLLHRNATLIQQWYRKLKFARLQKISEIEHKRKAKIRKIKLEAGILEEKMQEVLSKLSHSSKLWSL